MQLLAQPPHSVFLEDAVPLEEATELWFLTAQRRAMKYKIHHNKGTDYATAMSGYYKTRSLQALQVFNNLSNLSSMKGA